MLKHRLGDGMSSCKRRPKRPVNLKDLTSEHNRVVTLLANESDRSVAIVGSAFLDDVLRQMLSFRFVEDDELQHNLLRESGPLGTFSARIDVAYAIGLIPKSIHQDLHRIREMRLHTIAS
jgi:DNA-binding MltR family transcriptional regulator